ncbi:hypothetical protein KFK09_003637 [Dendrobium nobile]|uniref:Uncharacterized protein n=1 Tax=Dendrobium nobile TaxID=94219 RepID=A0A8T3C3Q8_DENNO|nr:hypothetical protein KFK09_003637 [Dendrobium nobile]
MLVLVLAHNDLMVCSLCMPTKVLLYSNSGSSFYYEGEMDSGSLPHHEYDKDLSSQPYRE